MSDDLVTGSPASGAGGASSIGSSSLLTSDALSLLGADNLDGFKVGDRVQVLNVSIPEAKRLQKQTRSIHINGWTPTMDNELGNTGIVSAVRAANNCVVVSYDDTDEDCWNPQMLRYIETIVWKAGDRAHIRNVTVPYAIRAQFGFGGWEEIKRTKLNTNCVINSWPYCVTFFLVYKFSC